MIEGRDIPVVMRDGTRPVLDVNRPDATGRYPVLYACSLHNKDIQGPDIADVLPPQPAHAPLWFGPIEAGNTRHFIANEYVHVIAQPRGSAKSEGVYGHEDTDHYDLIEWITRQSWCDGNVGMVGISGYAGEQWRSAAQGHPALKAIFPYDACSAYGGMFGFRDFAPGGVLHTFPYLLDVFSTVHESRDRPTELPPEQEELWRQATLYAAIDRNDTNWIVVLKDVGPDVSVRTAREGERAVPQNLPERELTRGWLKASYRAVDEKRSKPWEPFHKLTREAIAPVIPGEIAEYRIQILGTANRFKAGHRICLDITAMDVPTGTGAMTDVEYIPYHVCSSQTVTHRIYRDAERPSHLLLPIIPDRG